MSANFSLRSATATAFLGAPLPGRSAKWLRVGGLLAVLITTGHVQTAAPASANIAKDEDTPVVLSPFSVTSEADTGYQAANTLAGSRLNTKLSETPASVSVFTEEFLKDLGATGLAQVLECGVNSNADYNAVSTAPSFFYLDGGLLNDVRVNNRGLAGSRSIDFLETTLPTDTYNTGRFEVSSGPNSVLFGFGAAGGIINAQTRLADLRRTSFKLNDTVGSWNAYRGEIDVNVVALKDRLGFRVMAVHDEAETWRRYADRQTDRRSVVAGFKPFPTTTVTALYERGVNEVVVEVVGTWHNRLVGEVRGAVPKLTRTNILVSQRKPWKDLEMIEAGLFGPVRLVPRAEK